MYTDSESRLESEVKAFMENPDCGSDAYNFKRDLEGMDFVGLSSEEYNQTEATFLFQISMAAWPATNVKPISRIRPRMASYGLVSKRRCKTSVYKNFAVTKLQSWLKENPEWKEDGMVDYSTLIAKFL
jgi:chitinase